MIKIKNNPAKYKTRTRLVLKEVALAKQSVGKLRARARFIRDAKFDERGYVKVN